MNKLTNKSKKNLIKMRLYAGGLLIVGFLGSSVNCWAEEKALSKALIIGDSISIGYTKPLTKILKGKVVVVHNPGNAGTSKQGLANLERYLGKTKWDIIHFNHGMHDLRYLDDATGKDTTLEGKGHIKVPIEAYEKNMEAIVLRLKKTGAKLIFATTTPYPAGMSRPLSKYRQSKKYNEVALKIMNKHNVAVNDLYAFVKPRLEKLQIPGDIHFNQEGSNAMAEEVAKHILKIIKITNE